MSYYNCNVEIYGGVTMAVFILFLTYMAGVFSGIVLICLAQAGRDRRE